MPTSIDNVAGANLWTEQDISLFNKLPYYLTKNQVRYIKRFATWSKILDTKPWTPKMGTTMKGVRKEPSPILRGQFLPNTIQSLPKKDVIELAEVTESAVLYHHNIESNLLYFAPDFQDFLDNADAVNEDLSNKLVYLPDLFYRTAIWHGSPHVFVCGAAQRTKTNAPIYDNSGTITLAKSPNYVQEELIANCSSMLDFKNLDSAVQTMFNDLDATPWSGDLLPDGTDGSFLAQKYVLVAGNEFYANLRYDPYILQAKTLDLELVKNGFRGQINGQVTCKVERYELRFDSTGNVVAPETQEIGSQNYNRGETILNPNYVNAPYALAFLVGESAYKAIKPGPPPAPFSQGGMSMEKFNAMDWNGKPRFTRDILVKVLDQNGNVVNDTNKYGFYGQYIANIAMGIIPVRRRNILPLFYARARVTMKN